jgi:hypothetical protein
MMLLELARVRHGFVPWGTDGRGTERRDEKTESFVEKHDAVYELEAIAVDWS